MRQFKSQFHGGGEKDIIVVNVYVPSNKRKKAMTPQMKKDARKWAKETLSRARVVLADVLK